MGTIPRRRFLVAATGLAALAGCSSQAVPGQGSSDQESTPTDTPTDTATDGSVAVPTAAETLPLPMSPEELRQEAQSGGPPKDGIPSVDDPQFMGASEADFLDPGDPVFGVVRNGDVKAYNLVMYDRATETWWPQIPATSVPGPWNADPPTESLQEFRLVWTTWEQWREHNTKTEVLSTDTGFAKNYGNDPYGSYNSRGGYYQNDNLLFPALEGPDTFDNKTVVMGARTPDGAAAFLKDAIREKRVMTGEIGETPVVAVYDDRYDTAYVYANPDEQAFEYDDGAIVDTGGTAHQPDDIGLTRVHTFDAMWFAWAGYYPETNVYE